MNRRAVTQAFVMMMVLFLMLGLALYFFIQSAFQKTEGLVVEEKCRSTVEREAFLNKVLAQTKSGYKAADFAGNIECQTIPVSVKGAKEQEVVGLVGAYARKCWGLFDVGAELFSQGEGAFCHVCYVLSLGEGVRVPLTALRSRADLKEVALDVPGELSSAKAGVLFSYRKDGSGVQKTVFVRPLDPVHPEYLDVCAGAVFARQRLA